MERPLDRRLRRLSTASNATTEGELSVIALPDMSAVVPTQRPGQGGGVRPGAHSTGSDLHGAFSLLTSKQFAINRSVVYFHDQAKN